MEEMSTAACDVLTAAVMKVAIYWDIAPSIPYMDQRFGEMYHLHLQDRNQPKRNQLADGS
jgi:hypothetical protein